MSLRIHKPYFLYDDGKHKFVWLGLDEAEAEKGILTNQYLIVDDNEGLLVDPGGYHVFQRVVNNVSSIISPEKIKAIFISHQDPDVIGSINLLLDIFPNAKIYVPELWVRFIPHLGILVPSYIESIPDKGAKIRIGGAELEAIPAHFLHSPGNFHLYDPIAKILFSGDLGAAVFKDEWYLFVEDFDRHVKLMEDFHRRYIPCVEAIRKWLDRISGLEIEIIAPQHGAIFEGENVEKFINWLKNLEKTGIQLL